MRAPVTLAVARRPAPTGGGPLRVLCAGALGDGAALLRRALEAEEATAELAVVTTGHLCLERALAEPFDAVLVDHPLADRDVLDLVRELRARGTSVPLVVVTAASEESVGMAALRLGADDWVVREEASAARLGVTLARAVAHRQAREERDRLAALEEAVRAIGRPRDLRAVLDEVVHATGRLVGTERNLVALGDSAAGLRPRAWSGGDPDALPHARVGAESGLLARALVTRGPIAFAGLAMRELWGILGNGTEPPEESPEGLAVALPGDPGPLGVLVAAGPRGSALGAREAALLRAFAEHAASAIAHAQRLAESRARTTRLARALELATRVAGHRQFDDPLGTIAEEARRSLEATAAECWLLDGDALERVVRRGERPDGAGPLRVNLGESPWSRVVARGTPCRVPEIGKGAVVTDRTAAGAGAPLIARDRVVGVLAVHGRQGTRVSDEDLALLAAFAAQAAMTVEHSRLVQELLHAERLATVGRLVAGVAHELNNPLAVVTGTLDLLRREGLGPGAPERLERVAGQAQRAVKLVRSLLSLARKKPPRRETVDVNLLLGDTLELEDYEIRSARVTVERRLARRLPSLCADPDQLQQVFTNLILNAVEALQEVREGGQLTVSTELGPSRDRIVIAVTDDGPGIAPADQSRIFEPFFTTKGNGKGTGLGLAISRQIVEDHGGRLEVASTPGIGTTFSVKLPLSSEIQPAPESTAPCLAHPGRRARVLVVEDERAVADLMAEFLTLDGHVVERAADGREALKRLREHTYDVVVSDVRMPDLDGPSLYLELRARDPGLARRMVFVTGDVMSPDTRRFLEQAGLAYLEKPFGITEFQAAVRTALASA